MTERASPGGGSPGLPVPPAPSAADGGGPQRHRTRQSAAQTPGHRRRMRVGLALLALAIVGFLAAVRTAHQVQRDAQFCASSCHHPPTPASGTWHVRGHSELACQTCHTETLRTGFTLAWQAFVHDEHPAKHGQVHAQTCQSCHEASPVAWRLVAETPGHREHRGRPTIDCLSCHAKSTHGEGAAEQICLDCHKPDRLHKPSTADAETCVSCHAYAVSSKLAKKATPLACGGCHTSTVGTPGSTTKDRAEHALHSEVACQLCHNAHGKRPQGPEGQPSCARCHAFAVLQVDQASVPKGHARCEACHKPHQPLKTALGTCGNCHDTQVAGIVEGGRSTAVKHKSCAACHVPHGWQAKRNGCTPCHQEQAQLVQTRSPSGHGTCDTCHEVHGPSPSGAVCVKCHQKTHDHPGAQVPERHKDCVSCHNPHAPSPQATRAVCGRCHAPPLSEVARGPQGHAKEPCVRCHQPHGSPRPPENLCATCHADNARLVATAPPTEHQRCTSCHPKHTFAVNDTAAACMTCHGANKAGAPPNATKARTVALGMQHQGECTHCHAVHGPPSVPQAACFRCHDQVQARFRAPNELHGACSTCHKPHQPTTTALEACANCHAPKATVAATWPAPSAHAKACNGCHTSHDVQHLKGCAECHSQEATSAAGGRHSCVQCHPPHSAHPGTKPAWWSRCKDCHARQVQSVKALGPSHSSCQRCHTPHRFAAAPCTSCHAGITNKGLHGVQAHAATCTGCHTPHVKGEPSRAQCLTCHTQQQRHEPDARKCQACHLFR